LGIRSFISGLFSRKTVVNNFHIDARNSSHEAVSKKLTDLGLLPSTRLSSTAPVIKLGGLYHENGTVNNPSPNLRAHLDTIYPVNVATKVKEPVWVPTPEPNDAIQQRFEKFHKLNPHIMAKMIDLAFLAKANGHKHIGLKMIAERLRWYYTVEVKGSEPYRINNSYVSRYARRIMNQVPALRGFFKTRELY
jgi:hypothetical protein